jgi:hypothetical protein
MVVDWRLFSFQKGTMATLEVEHWQPLTEYMTVMVAFMDDYQKFSG